MFSLKESKGMLRNHFVYHIRIHSFVVHSVGHLVVRLVGESSIDDEVSLLDAGMSEVITSGVWKCIFNLCLLCSCRARDRERDGGWMNNYLLEPHNRRWIYTWHKCIKWIFVSTLCHLALCMFCVSSVNCVCWLRLARVACSRVKKYNTYKHWVLGVQVGCCTIIQRPAPSDLRRYFSTFSRAVQSSVFLAAICYLMWLTARRLSSS